MNKIKFGVRLICIGKKWIQEDFKYHILVRKTILKTTMSCHLCTSFFLHWLSNTFYKHHQLLIIIPSTASIIKYEYHYLSLLVIEIHYQRLSSHLPLHCLVRNCQENSHKVQEKGFKSELFSVGDRKSLMYLANSKGTFLTNCRCGRWCLPKLPVLELLKTFTPFIFSPWTTGCSRNANKETRNDIRLGF